MERSQKAQMANAQVILVNGMDEEIGTCDKYSAHRTEPGPKLHRAFSLFLFNNRGELLLQRRSRSKLTFSLIWANTCCSHPSPGENIITAAKKRAKFELGIDLDDSNQLVEVGIFKYIAKNGEWTEFEIDHVVYGNFQSDTIVFSPDEVDQVKWVDRSSLERIISEEPSTVSPWLIKIWKLWLHDHWGPSSLTNIPTTHEVVDLCESEG